MTITPDAPATTRMLWLDITRKCQLSCSHCYNSSGPGGDHSSMTRNDWLSIIDQAAAVGVEMVQVIGGEPTLHPDALAIANRALSAGLDLEVYSNLVHVSEAWWEVLQRPGASLATSYYSGRPEQHNTWTGRPSHARTRANIAIAVNRGVDLRVGVITAGGAASSEDVADLEALGVQRIRVDHVRPYGRATDSAPTLEGLCGNCGQGRAAVGPDGTVSPCIMSAWMNVGDAHTQPLTDILHGHHLAEAAAQVRAAHPSRANPCEPDRWCTPGVPDSGCAPRR